MTETCPATFGRKINQKELSYFKMGVPFCQFFDRKLPGTFQSYVKMRSSSFFAKFFRKRPSLNSMLTLSLPSSCAIASRIS